MERDLALSDRYIEPVVDLRNAMRVGWLGLGLSLIAVSLSLVGSAWNELPTPIQTARLWLVAIGAIAAGSSISMRPDRWHTWCQGTVVALACSFGLPAHWDSFRLLFEVLALVAASGAVVAAMPSDWRYRAISAIFLFHFGGICLAGLSPGTGELPPPWVVEQAFARVYNPYLQFIYLRNAYHFYSPQPGPASLLAFLIKTDTGKTDVNGRKQYTYEWMVVPKRPGDVRDPLGLTFYRRLSVTDQTSHGQPGAASSTEPFEKRDVYQRRSMATVDPLPEDNSTTPMSVPRSMPGELETFSYLIPDATTLRFTIPSYAQHVLMERVTDDDARLRSTVKVYRLEHRTPSVEEFRWRKNDNKKPDPYSPTTYRPFFLGEYDVYGKIVDPREPFLYWLIPVMPAPVGVGDSASKGYDDFLSRHAGAPFQWSQLR